MAVYTHVPEAEIARFVAPYGLGALRRAVPIAEGVENSNYRLETEGGRFILTLFERRTEARDLPYFIALMEHLSAAGLPVPRPMHPANGQALGRLAAKPALIVSFLPGRAVADPDAERCAAAGEALASLHRAGRSFPLVRDNPLGLAGWRPLMQRCAERDADGDADTLALTERALDTLEARWPVHLPAGTVHTDLFPDNVFFARGRVSGLIDFYFSCTDLLAYDLAVCIASWAFDAHNRYRPERADALVAGYAHGRPLDAEEHAALPLLCLGACVRFTLTRLFDRLFPSPQAVGRPKDPQQFAERLTLFLAQAER